MYTACKQQTINTSPIMLKHGIHQKCFMGKQKAKKKISPETTTKLCWDNLKV